MTSRPTSSGVGPPPLDAMYLLNCLTIGGSERKIVRLVNRLSKRSIRAGIAYLNGPDTLAGFLEPDVPRWDLARTGKFSFSAVRRLVQVLEATRCRTLFTVNMYPTLYASAARTLLGARSPQLVALVNTTDFGVGQRWRQVLYKRVLDRFETVVYGCHAQRRAWLGPQHEGSPRTSVIYNGVDLQEFSAAPQLAVEDLRERLAFPRDCFVIGSVGRLVPAKNHSALIDATAAVRACGIDARLLLVGEGELRDSLRRRAQRLGIDQIVHFTGELTDLRPVLALMSVFVLPSSFVETFSNAALEAMAMRRAVILSDVGGAAEMVRDGIDGRIVPSDQLSTALPSALIELARDRSKAAAFGAAARRRVEEMFTFERMVMQYEQIIGRSSHDDVHA